MIKKMSLKLEQSRQLGWIAYAVVNIRCTNDCFPPGQLQVLPRV